MRWFKIIMAGLVVAGAMALASPALAAGTDPHPRYVFVLAPADTAVSGRS